MAYLQPAARVVLPRAKERVHGLVEASVKHVQSPHRHGVTETQTPLIVIQVDADAGGVPVVGDGDASVLPVGIQPVLQAYAPVALRGGEADEAFPVAGHSCDPEVPDAFVLHVHLPVVLPAGILGRGQDSAEAGETGRGVRQVRVTDAALLHFRVKVRDEQVGVGSVWIQGEVLRHCTATQGEVSLMLMERFQILSEGTIRHE